MSCLIIAFTIIVPFTSGIILPKPIDILNQAIGAQKTTPLKINLDVGANEESSKLNVNGMAFEICSKMADYDHPMMPGADGKSPQLSSGARELNLIEEGYFIDMSGKKHVKALNGCWEMFWRENALTGSLICGFDIPEEYHRNDASIPKCCLYLNFPLWTKIGLEKARERKDKILGRASFLLDKKQEEMSRMKNTYNPFLKVFHYGNAIMADDKYHFQPLKSLEIIPSDDEIIWLQDDLLLNTKGLVFSKTKMFSQSSHVQLGAAYASPYSC